MTTQHLDELDRKILERLYTDARQSNREIARELGVAEGTIRLRLKRLMDSNSIEVVAITNIDSEPTGLIVYLWIDVDVEVEVADVLQALAAQDEITYVATLIGRADIMAITWVKDAAQLADYLHTSIDRIPGVAKVRYELAHRLIKHDYRVTHVGRTITQNVN